MSRAVGVLDPLTPYTSPGKRRLGEGRPYHTQVHVPFGGMRWVVNVFKAPPFPKMDGGGMTAMSHLFSAAPPLTGVSAGTRAACRGRAREVVCALP